MRTNYVIAIDGYSSCGKSTVAKELAKKLSFAYIDTGAMYRAVTLYCLQNNLIINDEVQIDALLTQLSNIKIAFSFNAQAQRNETMLNGTVVEDEIRGLQVSSHVSAVSKIKEVRQKLVELQRLMGQSDDVVMDGRDIGTVVFSDANLKIFMTADPSVRAQRRYDELIAKGESVSFDEILKNVTDRDFQDENRSESPLRRADDALILDNSTMTREQQFEWILSKIKR